LRRNDRLSAGAEQNIVTGDLKAATTELRELLAGKFLATGLDDIAPLSGSGASMPEPASLALLATSLLGSA
jgi:hypothetical protein